MHDSRALITQFIQSKAPFVHEVNFKKHQAVQNEVRSFIDYNISNLILTPQQCIALRTQAAMTGNKLRQTQALCDKYHQDLMQAQNRVERLQSTSVLASQQRGHVQHQENAKPVKVEEVKSEEKFDVKPDLSNGPPTEHGTPVCINTLLQ